MDWGLVLNGAEKKTQRERPRRALGYPKTTLSMGTKYRAFGHVQLVECAYSRLRKLLRSITIFTGTTNGCNWAYYWRHAPNQQDLRRDLEAENPSQSDHCKPPGDG